MDKPPFGSRIDTNHPFAQGLQVVVPFSDGGGTQPEIVQGQGTGLPRVVSSLNGGTWAVNGAGPCVHTTTGTVAIGTSGLWLPTSAATFAFVRRKTDAVLNGGRFMASNATGTSRSDIYLPFNDGVVYWDWAGQSAPNRLSVAGLAFSISQPDRWVFTAGPKGSAIWQNGFKVASQTTAVTRVAAADVLLLNFTAENQDLNWFQVSSTQWDDNLCEWWSAEPYAALYVPPLRRYVFLGLGGGAAGSPPQPPHFLGTVDGTSVFGRSLTKESA